MEIDFEMQILPGENWKWRKTENRGFIFLEYPQILQIDTGFLGKEKQLATEENF